MTPHTAYIAKMKTQLDELNLKMNELEMTKLRHQSKLAVAKLDELKAAGEDGWDAMVAEMEKMRDAFTHSFHYFKSQV